MTATDVTCPSCGTVSWFEELGRDAGAFCRSCDYPLFWVRATRLAPSDTSGDVGLRRLPGTAGRLAVATIDCPSCEEPNPINNRICIRCGADLRPVPAPPPAPMPTQPTPVAHRPAPPPPPPKRNWWPWIILGVLAVIAIVILIILLT